jgi:hypothetical protein
VGGAGGAPADLYAITMSSTGLGHEPS